MNTPQSGSRPQSSKADTSELRAAIGQKLSDVTNYITSYGKTGTTYDEGLDAIVELLAAQKQRWEAEARKDGIIEVSEFIEREVRRDKICGLENKYSYLQTKIKERIAALDAATGGQES
jgi:hypothetical protein